MYERICASVRCIFVYTPRNSNEKDGEDEGNDVRDYLMGTDGVVSIRHDYVKIRGMQSLRIVTELIIRHYAFRGWGKSRT